MAEHVQCSMLVNMILWCSWTALTVSGSREQERWILKLMTLCGKFSHMMISVHAFLNILPPSLCSLFFGNLYIYCAWHGHVHITGLNPAVFFELSASHFYSINFLCGRLMKSVWLMLFLSDKDRQTVFISLTVISLVGCFLFFLLRKPDSECSSSAEATEPLLQEEPCDNTATRWALRWHYGLCLCTQRRVQPRGSGADWMEQDEEQQQSKKNPQNAQRSRETAHAAAAGLSLFQPSALLERLFTAPCWQKTATTCRLWSAGVGPSLKNGTDVIWVTEFRKRWRCLCVLLFVIKDLEMMHFNKIQFYFK